MGIGEFFSLGTFIHNEYARASIVFVILLFFLRLLLGIMKKIILASVKRTQTDADDIIAEKSSMPLTIIAFLVSLRIALEELTLSSSLGTVLNRMNYSVMVIVIGYLIYIIIDVALGSGWKHISKKSKIKIEEGLTKLVRDVLKIALIVLGVLYIMDLWGVQILPLLGALGVAGIAVALALQPTLSNIFSGISIILDKSVRVGDWIILEDGTWGIVQKVGIRSTKVQSFDNEMIVIPNTKFADNSIKNVSQPEPKVRIVIPFCVAYGSKIDKVKEIVLKEILKIPGALKEPEPSVRFLEMGESSLNFKAYFFIESFENRLTGIDEANTRIYNALNKAGISIPFPQMDVHIKGPKNKGGK